MTGTVTKAKLLRQDLTLYDGQQLAASRRREDGGTLLGLAVGDWVDALAVYGGGSSTSDATLRQAVRAIGAARTVGLWLSPGTWDILSDLTLPANFSVGLAPGAVLSPAAGVTLTVNGPLFRHTASYTAGAGTVTLNGFDSMAITTGAITYVGDDVGSINAYECNPATAVGAYTDGQTYVLRSGSANTGAATIDLSELGPKSIHKNGGNDALTAGDIPADAMVSIIYDASGDLMHLLSAIVPDVQGGGAAPTKTKPFQVWPDTTTSLLKIRNSANSAWLSLGQLGAAGLDLGPIWAEGVLCPHANLVVAPNSSNPNYQVDVSADALVLFDDATDLPLHIVDLEVTVDLAVSGANGLDQGIEAVSTWYHLWAIAKQDGTLAGLLSLSAVSPTLPSGYSYKGYVGARYNDSGGDLDPAYQLDRLVGAQRSVVLSNGSATTSTAIDISIRVPPQAKAAFGSASVDDDATASSGLVITALDEASASSRPADITIYNVGNVANGLGGGYWRLPLLQAQTMYYRVVDVTDDASIVVSGWEH